MLGPPSEQVGHLETADTVLPESRLVPGPLLSLSPHPQPLWVHLSHLRLPRTGRLLLPLGVQTSSSQMGLKHSPPTPPHPFCLAKAHSCFKSGLGNFSSEVLSPPSLDGVRCPSLVSSGMQNQPPDIYLYPTRVLSIVSPALESIT